MTAPVLLREVPAHAIPSVCEYVMTARAHLFPMLDATVMPADLANFAQVYGPGSQGRFLLATQADEIIGAIGYLPYDHRFAQLDYRGLKTVEVVRLYVSPGHRGQGLARRLYEALKALAQADQVQVLYLHTHPFLPGAIEFWHKQGFVTVDTEDDPVWRTTHMHLRMAGVR
ncbi:GNAT family N-acetyltransferase [Pseudomonas sp.]|uniref:GNAT family N-acetyltransferase n=1 Tax=Pseudomonas sp. TaxID=306 RepID=UPI00258586E7|nr:GNAT family N-acetyltransferase [Pseudomonas sp.]